MTGACEYPKRTHVYKYFSFYRRWYASTKTKFSTMYNKLLTVNQIYTRVKIRAWNSSTKNFEYFLSIAPREAKKKSRTEHTLWWNYYMEQRKITHIFNTTLLLPSHYLIETLLTDKSERRIRPSTSRTSKNGKEHRRRRDVRNRRQMQRTRRQIRVITKGIKKNLTRTQPHGIFF